MRFRLGEYELAVRWLVAALMSLCSIFLSGCTSNQEISGECYYAAKSAQRTLPKNDIYVINADSKEGSRIDVYFQIPYSRIHFEKDQDLFEGSYSVSFVLRGEDETVVRTRDVDRTVIARSYNESVSSRHDAFLELFPVTPGIYSLSIAVADNRTRRQYRRRYRVVARDFSKAGLALSDYLLFERPHPEKGIISISPLFPSDLSFAQDSIGMFQELYNVQRGDTVLLRMTCGAKKANASSDSMIATLSPPFSPNLPECRHPIDSVYYVSDSAFVVTEGGRLELFQYFLKPREGVTTLTRTVYRFHKGEVDSAVTIQKLLLYPSSFPRVNGVGEEIAAVSCIARPDEYATLRDAKTPAERIAQLDKFWEQHGGSIRRKEFLDRVTEANELFSSCTEGWKTPMGIVYIVCGPPDYVECRGRVDEVWSYDLGGNSAFVVPFRQSLVIDYDRYFELPPFSVNEFTWDLFVDRWRRQ